MSRQEYMREYMKRYRASKRKIIDYYIDAEFWDNEIERIEYQRKNSMSAVYVKRFKHAYMGVYDPVNDTYQFMDIKKFQHWFIDQCYKPVHLRFFTFFSYAELQFFPDDFLELCFKDVHGAFQVGQSVYVKVQYKNAVVEVKDIQKLTNATSLKELINAFAKEEKKSLEQILKINYDEMKEIRADIGQVDIAEIEKYNYMDCKLAYIALNRFSSLLKQKFGTKHSLLDCMTLGHWLYLLIRGFGYELLEDEYEFMKKQERMVKKGKMDSLAFLQKYLQLIKEFYIGGGIITTLANEPHVYTNCSMIDAKSLYPISLLRVLRVLPTTYAEIQVTTDATLLDQLMQDDSKYFIAYCKVKIKDGYDNVVAYRIRQNIKDLLDEEDEQYITAYTREIPERGYAKDELLVIQEIARIEKVSLIMYWDVKPEHYAKLFNLIQSILKERLSTDDPTLNYIYKIFLNSLYGKFAQKRITSIKSTIVAGLITSVSRAIMIRAYKALKDAGLRCLHFATDSIVLTGQFKHEYLSELYDWLESFAQLGINYFSVECEDAEFNLIRNKVYCIKKDGKVVKFAHHAIHLPKSKKIKEEFMSKINPNKVYYWLRDTYMKIDECRHLYDSRVLFKVIVELNVFVYKPDSKNKYYKSKVVPFNNINEYLKHYTNLNKAHTKKQTQIRKEIQSKVDIVTAKQDVIFEFA